MMGVSYHVGAGCQAEGAKFSKSRQKKELRISPFRVQAAKNVIFLAVSSFPVRAWNAAPRFFREFVPARLSPTMKAGSETKWSNRILNAGLSGHSAALCSRLAYQSDCNATACGVQWIPCPAISIRTLISVSKNCSAKKQVILQKNSTLG